MASSSQKPAEIEAFLTQAIDLALASLRATGARPFGAVLVKDGEVIATGVNEILATNDPTAHAELTVIRAAARKLGSPRLEGCVIYASGHPCPMCLAAMHMTGIDAVYYAYDNEVGKAFGLSTAAIYDEMRKPFDQQKLKITCVPIRPGGADLYELWHRQAPG
ncbi:nucleoside deaminase [Dongia soli]|uniref:Nucleoside deaminase n=1 Tax=Dongia soli TaxID=600628 RepID=A0ABU5EGN1_9PROT|nr:nucleoside deaminase [Dongia soli]MDY0884645.1 nucleoside deaminase [Dongia soli]